MRYPDRYTRHVILLVLYSGTILEHENINITQSYIDDTNHGFYDVCNLEKNPNTNLLFISFLSVDLEKYVRCIHQIS